MKGSARDLEDNVKASVILMGSFQFTNLANDIDLIIVYQIANYGDLKKIKRVITKALDDEFGLPVHYTTLSLNEYADMEQLHKEKHQIIFNANSIKRERK